MGYIVKGVLGAVVLHLIAFATVFGATVWSTQSYEDASDRAKLLPDGAAASEQNVLFALTDARSAMLDWVLAIFFIGLVCTLLFLVRSATATAAVEEERATLKPMWVILLLGIFGLSAGLWWVMLAAPEAVFAMLWGNYAMIVSLSFALLMLSYFLSTVLFVKPLLAPSVPLASTIRGI